MRHFIIIWLGQIASSIGSSMTYFALTIWVWQQTQSASEIALILFFYQFPQIVITIFSGILADRFPRKHLLIISDIGSAFCTISVGILAASQLLQLWHIYLIAAIIGCFGNIQSITYTTTVPLIVPPERHSRATSMGAMVGYGAGIVAPALSGILYPLIGLLGITTIDLLSFLIATFSLLFVPIPQVQSSRPHNEQNIWRSLTFSFRYILSQPNLMAMMMVLSAFAFFHQIGEAIYQPMLLARTNGNTQIVGAVVAASGLGGVIGAITIALWQHPYRRSFAILFGFIGQGLGSLLLGISQLPMIWILARFVSSFHSPLIFSSYTTIWYAKIAPDIQGRVFAADYLVGLIVESSANLVSGFLADEIFEPFMLSNLEWNKSFSILTGNSSGKGISLLFILTSIIVLGIGLLGFIFPRFKNVEQEMPDHSLLRD